jgi:antitoxin (DNA-binding transcriptional repressor) of toxin-antitoxin stability system
MVGIRLAYYDMAQLSIRSAAVSYVECHVLSGAVPRGGFESAAEPAHSYAVRRGAYKATARLTPLRGSRYLRIGMPRSTYSVSQAQSALPRLVREVESGALVGIARRDETVAYLVSRRQLEAIVETMKILANPRARKAIADHRAGRTRFSALSAIDRGD